MTLPVNINDLINGQTVESERIEFKEGWNPEAILHTICAFVNDINNWGGGYIIIGVRSENGRSVLPPVGLSPEQIDACHKKLVELCHKITPNYFPVSSLEKYQGKRILVLWVSGGETRPYKAPKTLAKKSEQIYYVRRFASTVKANTSEENQLYSLAAKIPLVVARIYRNRRIGDFLKELDLTEGRSTGFPKIRRAMKFNGSPQPTFETNKNRDYFLTILPIHPQAKKNAQVVPNRDQVGEQVVRILEFCRGPKKKQEILKHISLSPVYLNYKRHIQPLINKDLLELTIPDKPQSSKQKYKTTEKGLTLLKEG